MITPENRLHERLRYYPVDTGTGGLNIYTTNTEFELVRGKIPSDAGIVFENGVPVIVQGVQAVAGVLVERGLSKHPSKQAVINDVALGL